jgi:polyhydroxyalkanoate synthase
LWGLAGADAFRHVAPFTALDGVRRAQANGLAMLGIAAEECRHRTVAEGARWRLRAYSESGTVPVLIVSSPIKRPYIWDLAQAASAIRRCVREGLRVYLLEWRPLAPGDADAGLAEYAHASIADAISKISWEANGVSPFLMGHSLGGTLAAIYAAIRPGTVRGLVLLSAPLCFAPGSSRFRDALMALVPPKARLADIVPGSLLSHISALAAPGIFVWDRSLDGVLSAADPALARLHLQVERWTLDEVALSGRLVGEILERLYRNDEFRRGALALGADTAGPSALRVPVLAVTNTADGVAPRGAVKPFLDAMPAGYATILEYPGEHGVALQHVAVLVGPRAHAELWRQIVLAKAR